MGERYTGQYRGSAIGLLLAWLLGAILILPGSVSTPGHVLAQGNKSTTVYLPLGKQQAVDVSFATMNQWGEEYEIYVYRQGGGPLGGLKVWASARTAENCRFELRIETSGYPVNFLAEENFEGPTEWIDPVTGTVPGGYDSVTVVLMVDDYCYDSPGYGQVGIMIEGDITPTPAYTPTPYQPPEAVVEFWTDQNNINQGQCTTLNWYVENVKAAYLKGGGFNQGVSGPYGVQQVCPATTTTYELHVTNPNGSVAVYSVTIFVQEPTPTPWPTNTFTPYPTATPFPQPTPTSLPTFTATFQPHPTATPRPTSRPTATPSPRLTATPIQHPTSTGTVTRTPTPTPLPKQVSPTKLDCKAGDGHTILIVTDSDRLNHSTGQTNAWNRIKPRIENYYTSRAVECNGMPLFLDLASEYPAGRYTWLQVDASIQSVAEKARLPALGIPAAVVIIGGPNVVPMAELNNPRREEGSTLYTDDLYGDFDGDQFGVTDTLVARLPDGGSLRLLENYLDAFEAGVSPSNGAAVLASLDVSLHHTNAALSGNVHLEDILADKEGSVTYLLSPPWLVTGHLLGKVNQELLSPDDAWNYDQHSENPGELLNVKEVLFYHLWPGENNRNWQTRDTRSDDYRLYNAFGPLNIDYIPGTGGWHVFAIVSHSADLISGVQDRLNSIPLAYLYEGAHHFIGTTGKVYFDTSECRILPGNPVAVCDTNLDKYANLFAQYYYLTESDDPAAAFMSAKFAYAGDVDLHNPFAYNTYHSFVYYGLPAGGQYPGVYRPMNYRPLPTVSLYPNHCPSGNSADCDGDGFSDQIEHKLVEAFKPKLFFDRREGQPDIQALQAYWQVTPMRINFGPGNLYTYGAYLTMVMAWPYDYGTQSFDGVSAWDDVWCKFSDAVIGFNYISNHCGDTEGVRFFIQYKNGTSFDGVDSSDPGRDWRITHVDWKRHHEGFNDPGDPLSLSRVRDLQFEGLHPILYVSGLKHAMYPNLAECSAFTHSELGCEVRFELCEPRLSLIPRTPADHNIGERPPYGYILLDQLSAAEYPGESAWNTGIFCGGITDDSACLKVQIGEVFGKNIPPCSGGMGNMWYPDKPLLEHMGIDVESQLKPVLDDEVTRYTVYITTSNIDKAGTDAHVTIGLHGTTTSYPTMLFTPSRGADDNPFERGDSNGDSYDIYDLGDITQLCITHDHAGSHSGWHVASARVISSKGSSWDFTFNRWLDETEPPNYTAWACAQPNR